MSKTKDKPIGVTIGWFGTEPRLCFEGGKIYFKSDLDKKFHPEYFKNGEWPTDPETGERLPIYKAH